MSAHTETLNHAEEGIELAGYEGAKLGMWLFLAQEILFFGGLFAAYVYFRSKEPVLFELGSRHLDWILGGINTVVLLLSSLTVALAVDSIQRGNVKKLRNYLLATTAFACVFMVIKFFEYEHKYHMDLSPVAAHHEKAPADAKKPFPKLVCEVEGKMKDCPKTNTETTDVRPFYQYGRFLPLYFMMTGVHGLHVLIGIFIMIGLWVFAGKGDYTEKYYVPVENSALYWHLVDLIWIFLFPLMYLIG